MPRITSKSFEKYSGPTSYIQQIVMVRDCKIFLHVFYPSIEHALVEDCVIAGHIARLSFRLTAQLCEIVVIIYPFRIHYSRSLLDGPAAPRRCESMKFISACVRY